MHLLAAQPGAIDDGEPVDLGQTPADLVVISAADTELAALSQARAEMEHAPSLRLASLMHLRHPMSVDLHLDTCATQSRLVVARVLGGRGYWTYGLEQYAARLHDAGVPFAALPGDDKPDAELRELSTVSAEDYDALWACLVEGGPANAQTFLAHASAMLEEAPRPAPARPLLRAGLYWPGVEAPTQATLTEAWTKGAPTVPVIFYRALLQGAGLNPVNRLVRALLRAGLNPLPVFVASLKDPVSAATLEALFTETPPDAILNLTSFAVGDATTNPLSQPWANRAPVFQGVLSGGTEQAWRDGLTGLSARDIAMNVALPELDGRVLTRALGFKGEAFFDEATQCPIATWKADGDRITFTADLLANWCRLRRTATADKRVALVLANYPNRDGRLANGVGLDTPAATVHTLGLLADQGYSVENAPRDSASLMDRLLAGPTNWLTDRAAKEGGETLDLETYRAHYATLPLSARQAIEERWGTPEEDPFFSAKVLRPDGSSGAGFALSIHRFGRVCVGLQPARGYNVDPTDSYHSPDLVPPHNYLAFYVWLRAQSDVIVHMGKHGNLEWLPGRAVALGAADWPEIALGPTPHVYPFIVNDPGEGTQAKRRGAAVIIDHLTPPLTRAESYGPLRDLEALVDEYYEAAGVDPRRIETLRDEILSLAAVTGLDVDAGFQGDDGDLAKLDAYLCELKEAQIRDGLHIFGQSPQGRLRDDLLQALLRLPRGDGHSLPRAIATDLGLEFDPLDCDMAAPWEGARPDALSGGSAWRSAGDTVERIEGYAARLLRGDVPPPGPMTAATLEEAATLRATLDACGPAEGEGLLTALAGQFVAPAPSGAPTRGRPDVLPTGRNFYSVDSRAVPTPTAWKLGWKSANLLIERHLQDHGDWPRAMLVTAWGTANMRTGGDDIAQSLALMGVKPRWDSANRRVVGFEIIPATTLGRPRVDVTLRVSGFFRDAFPQQMALVDAAARAVQDLDEPEAENPAAAAVRAGEARARVYGSKPGAYGAGLQAMIDERLWSNAADLGRAYVEWGGYAYGDGEGKPDHDGLRQRLGQVEAIVQNQDNREHDLLDSDDYYQFEGGAAAAVEMLQGAARPVYHNDHSRPERPIIRTLDEEIGRVVRSRVVNPKWIEGVKRHGYKGAFEIAATVDYLFAFAATTGAVKDHHFDLVHAAVLEDDDTRAFIAEANAPALADIADRLREAIERGLWTPRSNSARALLEDLGRS
ncbi:cobaltochelatase subunit CobN [Jannaschia pagri]|uniref:Cobaltochelatase subunit CobN n=1 Tax=Jannaschia pagri TaxID=2829797 RepID=A0ABQ4NI33_9RHOB|nr:MULTISPECIES: cobaltochelatase subunit CobN [unclassified Jannaschia]GIT89818.1 cobaltochelatase subunit CobN [Jannaschia sp. AI_61]GIT94075.1 cobaltochelatase subunit CobN [Jannaschia sp. AI_62]